jgi:predicted dehydrogenase
LITGKQSEPFLGVLLTYDQTRPNDSAVQQIVRTAPTLPTQNAQELSGKPVRLGILGAGNFATAVMLPAIQKIPEIEKIAIASGNGANAQHASRKFAFQYAASTASQILEDPDINTIAILTRHNLHAAQVAAGLRAGKHVFCEKPLALSFDELEDIAQVLAGIPNPAPLLTVGFNRRFAPLVVKLKAFLQNRHEPMAAHYRINAGYIPLNHWLHDPAQGGGRIVGEGCHFIDLLTFLVGQMPTHIQALGLPDGGRYREDNVVLQVHFADGSLGTISYMANGDKAYAKEYLEVFSGGRVAVLDDFRTLTLVKDGQRRTHHSRLRQDKGHKAAWQAFTRAINLGEPAPIPYTELFAVSRASLVALIALRTGEKIPILK